MASVATCSLACQKKNPFHGSWKVTSSRNIGSMKVPKSEEP